MSFAECERYRPPLWSRVLLAASAALIALLGIGVTAIALAIGWGWGMITAGPALAGVYCYARMTLRHARRWIEVSKEGIRFWDRGLVEWQGITEFRLNAPEPVMGAKSVSLLLPDGQEIVIQEAECAAFDRLLARLGFPEPGQEDQGAAETKWWWIGALGLAAVVFGFAIAAHQESEWAQTCLWVMHWIGRAATVLTLIVALAQLGQIAWRSVQQRFSIRR